MTIHLISTLDKKEWPSIWQKCFNIFISSPYKVKLWNTKDIIDELKKDDLEFYNNYLESLDDIFKIDYIRYIILEKYGGAYFDLDIEIKQDFLQYLDPSRLYFLEGDVGEHVANSLMISPSNGYQDLWAAVKLYMKQRIIKYYTQASQDKYNVVWVIGSTALSNWFIKYYKQYQRPLYRSLSILHFSEEHEISFARHHTTSYWLKE
jgi:mannosyltransferase OCH1-like enzyme